MDATAIIKDLFSKDRYAAALGMRLVSADPVVVEMPLTRDHENFYDIAHGGAVYSVAPTVRSASRRTHPVTERCRSTRISL